MRLLVKSIICAAIVLVSIAVAPSARADGITVPPITIESSGFSLTNLGNTGGGMPGKDSLTGVSAHTVTNPAAGPGTFPFLMNLLTFETGFTGNGSRGSHDFTFTQLISVNGVTQTLHMTGVIVIGSSMDSVHLVSTAPLTFEFSTFSVDVRVPPATINGWGAGTFHSELIGEYTIRTGASPVPEPATLSLLGLGLAGVAAKVRKRRRERARQALSTPAETI